MAKNRSEGPLPLGDILRERLRALGWEKKLRELEIFRHWEAAVGPQIASRARPVYVRSKRLTIAVDNPVWSQQLVLLKRDLLHKFDRILGEGVIEDIYLVSGKVDFTPEEEEAPGLEKVSPDPALVRAIEEEASLIRDPDLREAFRRALLASSRRKPPL